MKILITGSRYISARALRITRNLVRSLLLSDHTILCGGAKGVDHQVVIVARKLWRLNQIQVFLANRGEYLKRDRKMVHLSDKVIAIWNGKSRGTKYTFTYAKKLKKPVQLYVFGENER